MLRGRHQPATMNSFPRRIDNDHAVNVNLKKTLKTMQEGLRDMEQDVELAKGLLVSTGRQMAVLRSQMAEIRALVDGGAVQQCTASASHHDDISIERVLSTHKRSEPSSSESDDVIILPEEEAPESPTKRLRTHSEPEIQIELEKGRSEKRQDLNRHLAHELKDMCSGMRDSETEAIALAAYKTKGTLTPQDFLTFLDVSREVDDPLQLARVSFTTETSKLYFQLLTFSFHLRNVCKSLQEIYGPFQVDSGFQGTLNHLVRVFRECHMSKTD